MNDWPEHLKSPLRLMLASRTPMFIWWGNDLINLHNDACAEIFGRRRMDGNALGRPAAEVRHEIWTALGTEVVEVMKTNRANSHRERLLVIRRNGRSEETYFSFSLSPIRNEWGGAVGVFGACTDDTPRVLGERRVDTLRALGEPCRPDSLRAAAQAAASALAANAHDVPFALIYVPADDGRRVRLLAAAGAVPPRIEGELQMDSPSNPWPFHSTAAQRMTRVEELPSAFEECTRGVWPEPAAGAAVIGLGGSEHDGPDAFLVLGVSPRLPFDEDYAVFFELAAGRVASMLRAAGAVERRVAFGTSEDEQRNEFLAILAHELRNPLAPIRSAAELLKYVDRNPVSLGAREIIDRQLAHLVRLMDDLLDASRISRGKLVLRMEAVDLRQAAAAAVESVAPAIEEAGHELTLELCDEPVTVSGDAARLAQILANLLSNATEYTPGHGHIRLAVERAGDTASILVEDDGVGISADMLPRIFDMFTQADPKDDRPRKGLGIGLTIAQRLVEMHGGSLIARSAGRGRGSLFTVALPLTGAKPIVLPHPSVPTPAPSGGALKLRILVADDNTDAVSAISEILNAIGHDVRTAVDGLEAVELAESFRPQLILLDIGMPRLDGYEACRRIRQRPWGRDVPIYAVTGWGQASDRRRTRKAGFNAHLVKPVAIEAIEKLIQRPSG